MLRMLPIRTCLVSALESTYAMKMVHVNYTRWRGVQQYDSTENNYLIRIEKTNIRLMVSGSSLLRRYLKRIYV